MLILQGVKCRCGRSDPQELLEVSRKGNLFVQHLVKIDISDSSRWPVGTDVHRLTRQYQMLPWMQTVNDSIPKGLVIFCSGVGSFAKRPICSNKRFSF